MTTQNPSQITENQSTNSQSSIFDYLEYFLLLHLLEILLLIIPYGVLLYLLPLFIISPLLIFSNKSKQIWWQVERKLYSYLPYLVAFYPYRRNYSLVAYGEYEKLQNILENYPNDCGIVIANHQTAVDISTLIQFWGAISKKISGFGIISWIQDYLLGILPTGWVSKIHGDFFVLQSVDVNQLTKLTQCKRSSKNIRHKVEEGLRNHVKSIFQRHRFLQFFPEGGFFENRKASSRRFAKNNNLPHLEHVNLPRTAGMSSIINVLNENDWLERDQQENRESADSDINNNNFKLLVHSDKKKVRHLITLTICYPNKSKPWSVWDVLFRLPVKHRQNCYVHIKIESLNNMPLPSVEDCQNPKNNPKIKQPEKNQSKETIKNKMHEPFETFLISKFQEMDKIKAQFYENGGAAGISAENTYDLTLSRCKLWGHYLLSWVCGTAVIAGVTCLILFA